MTGDWGAILARLLTRRINLARLVTHALSVCPRSHQLPHLSPRLTDPRPHVWQFHQAIRGAPRCAALVNEYLSTAAPRRCTIVRGGSLPA
jgi:hypothetical protein